MPQVKPRHAAGAMALAALACAGVSVKLSEGTKYRVYRDSIGKATFCTGDTNNPDWNHTYTKQECDDLLETRLSEFQDGVRSCVTQDMPVKTEAAFIAFAYNVGTGAFCKSSIVRLWNAGDKRGSCDALLLYNRAGGNVLRGLTLRRERERKLCLEGL
jgi:lysozyme